MQRMLGITAATVCLLMVPMDGSAQSPVVASASPGDQQDLPWQESGRGMIGALASIAASPDARYLPGIQSARFLSMKGNPRQTGQRVIAPPDGSWFATYSYEPSGHIDDRDVLRADDLMRSLLRDEEAANTRRAEIGLPALRITGWEMEPQYDSSTNSLQWGLRIRSDDGQEILNRTVRILGREGYVSGTLVTRQGMTTPAIMAFDAVNRTVRFERGSSYMEFQEGDRIAQYGMSALVTGGVGAVAIKTGAAQGMFAAVFTGIEGVSAMIAALLTAVYGAVRRMRRRLRRDHGEASG